MGDICYIYLYNSLEHLYTKKKRNWKKGKEAKIKKGKRYNKYQHPSAYLLFPTNRTKDLHYI